ncbi:MAG: lactate dehydrogenase, partial [Planctomycetaceae bacterium]|nr:lactate dehydrogenase [Planctomycetaceae bacterium]
RGSGAEVIAKKGGAGFAVGASIADVIHAVALDQRRILPVSSLQNGAYGLHDVCISVPTIVGRGGAMQHIEVELWPKELAGLQRSGSVLRETINKVLQS